MMKVVVVVPGWSLGGPWAGPPGPNAKCFPKLWPPKFPYHTGRRGGLGHALLQAFPQGHGNGISSGVASPAPLGVAGGMPIEFGLWRLARRGRGIRGMLK